MARSGVRFELTFTLMSSLDYDPKRSGRGASTLVAVISVLLVFAWVAARIHYQFGGNWTAAFYTGTTFKVPPDLQAGTYRINGAGYDGQFYRYLAHDPFLKKGYFRYVDAPQLRFRRLLVPLLAWLLALGRQQRIDSAYVAVEMLFVGLGVYWCARLLRRRGRPATWGLLFVILPATMASLDRMLVDAALAALFAGFWLYCEEQRWNRVWVITSLAALTRETGLLLCVALLMDRLRHRDWRGALWSASSAAPAALWYVALAFRLPRGAFAALLDIPGWGIIRRLFWFRPYPDPRIQLLLRITDVLAVLGLVVSIVLAIRWLWERVPGPVTLCVALFAMLALVLGAPVMAEAFAFGRPVSPLLLWVSLEAVSRTAWTALAAPLLVSLSVSLAFARSLLAVAKGLGGL